MVGRAPSPVALTFILLMAKSKQGGVYGYLRGKVGAASYSIMSAKRSSSGKTEQVVRAVATEVSNPQTASQAMQRMKLAPAQRFYTAFSELLGNAFEGVAYGDKSRQYFISKALKQEGPYVQKGVDRFIPAAYPFSEGSLPSVNVMPFAGGASVITLNLTTTEAAVTPALLADLLGVDVGTQLTVAVVNNINGLFVPSYVSYDDRLYIKDLPAAALGKDAENHITIDPAVIGVTVSAMVACCVVLSRQDAGGNWLRSTQEMVLSDELRASLYSTDALNAAIYSYQTATGAANSINNEWYYNLGMAQPFAGKLIVGLVGLTGGVEYAPVVGVQQNAGRIKNIYFYQVVDGEERVILVEDGAITTKQGVTRGSDGFEFPYWEEWQDAYASQLGF